MLKLTSVQIDKLEDKANHQVPPNYTSRCPFSRYEAVSSHLWRSICRARCHVNEQSTRLHVAVNFRSRMDPPLSPFYFGNAVLRAVTVSTSGEIVLQPLGYTTSKIRSAVDNITDEYVRASLVYLDGIEDLSQFQTFHSVGCTKVRFYGNPNFVITSWIGLLLWEEGFGWGKNAHMGPGAIGFDGRRFIMPSHDGFTVPIQLQTEYMDDFQ